MTLAYLLLVIYHVSIFACLHGCLEIELMLVIGEIRKLIQGYLC
jgi:hypothetical protein